MGDHLGEELTLEMRPPKPNNLRHTSTGGKEMNKVDEYEQIPKVYHVEGLSIREISRRYKHSRRWVLKALEHPAPENYHLCESASSRGCIIKTRLSIVKKTLNEFSLEMY